MLLTQAVNRVFIRAVSKVFRHSLGVGSRDCRIPVACSGKHTMAGKTVLIVYAHQSPTSFNFAARKVAEDALKEQGCKVLISDLYAMDFQASAARKDISGDLKKPENFKYGDEIMAAWQEGRLSKEITDEHSKVEEAELIIFQFPMYWFSVPAIMKGWFDKVFSQGFAYSLQNMYDNGIFKDKKAMLSFTTGAIEPMFSPEGISGDINVALWPLQSGVLHFCGFQVLEPQIFWSIEHTPPPVRTALLDAWGKRLRGIWEEKPLFFASSTLFDLSFQGGFCLTSEAKEKLRAAPHGITTGQHLCKPVPPNNQTTSKSKNEAAKTIEDILTS